MSVPPAPDGTSSAHVRDLLDARLQALLDELEDVAERHGRELSLLGLVGTVELNFEQHGYRNARLALFLKPSLRVRRRRAEAVAALARRAQDT